VENQSTSMCNHFIPILRCEQSVPGERRSPRPGTIRKVRPQSWQSFHSCHCEGGRTGTRRRVKSRHKPRLSPNCSVRFVEKLFKSLSPCGTSSILSTECSTGSVMLAPKWRPITHFGGARLGSVRCLDKYIAQSPRIDNRPPAKIIF